MADPSKPSDPWFEPTTVRPAAAPAADDPTVLLHSAAAAASFAPGELLANRFRVIRFLGHGGMGDVYEAEDEEVHGRVALKTIRPEIARLPGALERFGREIHLARKVTHPNVCRIFDISHHGEVTFLTMELLPGETLEQRLRRTGAMGEEEALPIARQMAEGLTAAHRVGVVHRDFKPANVMLVPEDGGERAVVMDFGLARGGEPVGGGLTVRGDILGTPSYMAPEQVAGEEITPVTDVYAFGIVLYEMVTGALPFVGETAMSTAVKRLREDPAPPRLKVPGLDPAWNDAILHCMERDPRQRFASVREAVAVLAAEAPPTVMPSPKRRRWWLAAAALMILIGLGAAAWWWTVQKPRAEAEKLAETAKSLSDQGKYTEAIAAYERARKALAGIGESGREHQALGSQGLALGNSGNVEQGRALITQALDYFEETKNKEGQANQLLNLGTMYQRAGDPEQARKYFARGLTMAQTANAPSLEALAAFDLGTVFYYQGRLKDAQDNFQKALMIRQKLGEADGAMESGVYLAEVLLERNLPEQAVEPARKAVEAFRRSGNTSSEAEAGALLARIRLKQSNVREARSELDSVERLAETSQDPYIRGVVALAAGYVLAAEGESDQAVRRLEAVLKEGTSGLDLELGLALGEIETARGNHARGHGLLKQVEEQARGARMVLIANKAARALSQ